MKNIFITLICVIIACTFINMYMNNKILETTIFLNNLHAEYNAKISEQEPPETLVEETEETKGQDTTPDKSSSKNNQTTSSKDKSTDTSSTTQSENKTKKNSTEKSKQQIDVNTVLKEVSFADKLFLSSILVKIGGVDTVNKLAAGDKETIASVKDTLSQEEIEKLNLLSVKYNHILGNYNISLT